MPSLWEGKMKRTKGVEVSAILTSDWHLRETTPICRTDDFQETQWCKVAFVAQLQTRYDCPVLHAGDLFDYWKPSPHLLSVTLQLLPNKFHTIYGQHDLPQHSLDLLHKSGIFTLYNANRLKVLGGTHFGQDLTRESEIIGQRRILVWHKLVWTKTPPWPDCREMRAEDVLRKWPQYELIVTGDNHKPFVVYGEKNILVNPGSLMRQTADQTDHRPRVYLWYAKSNTVEPIYIPIEKGVISREHIEKKAERDLRIEAFISRLSDDWKAGLSFEENLQKFFDENTIRDSIKDIIWKSIEAS